MNQLLKLCFSFLLFTAISANAQWTTFQTSNSNIPDNGIFDIAVDANNTIWVATGQGMASFDGTIWTIFDINNSPIPANSNNDFYAVFIDNNQHVWLGTDDGYLLEYDMVSNWTDHSGNNQFGDINDITQDHNGDMWIAHNFGLKSFDGVSWTDQTTNLPHYRATTLEVDQQNVLWVGTSMGVTKYDNVSQWTDYNTSNSGLSGGSVSVRSIKSGVGDDIWIGTSGGIYRFDRDTTWVKYTESNSGLQDDQVNSIVIDSDSIVWIANDAATMGQFENGVWTHTFFPFMVNFSKVIVIDNDGYKWIGCQNALIKLNAQGGGVIPLGIPDHASGTLGISNYPNPCNEETTFSFTLPEAAVVDLRLVDMHGREINQLVAQHSEREGTFEVRYDTSHLPKGLYFAVLSSAKYSISSKVVVLR